MKAQIWTGYNAFTKYNDQQRRWIIVISLIVLLGAIDIMNKTCSYFIRWWIFDLTESIKVLLGNFYWRRIIFLPDCNKRKMMRFSKLKAEIIQFKIIDLTTRISSMYFSCKLNKDVRFFFLLHYAIFSFIFHELSFHANESSRKFSHWRNLYFWNKSAACNYRVLLPQF